MSLQFFETLVPALLHTLWIGLISAVLLFAALRITKASSVRLRYSLGIAALLSVILGGLFAWERPEAEQKTQSAPTDSPTRTSSLATATSLSETESAVVPSVENVVVHANPAVSVPNVRALNKPMEIKQMDWRKPIGLCWMLGALISLLRLFHISWNIQQLVRKSRVIENETVQRLMAELAKTAGFSRRVLMLTGEHIVQPAVAGIVRPALFLPLSVVTGLPEWQLRAILAHELAHIVRNDFLVNTLQLLAETLLFFNPAVWWINRRIREEREVCCDALAAQWIDSKTALAETLIDQANIQSGALPAFGGSDSGSLKNRILRLIHPTQKPHLKLPWKSLLLVLLLASFGLFLAKQGTSKAIDYLNRMQVLTDFYKNHDDSSTAIHRNAIHLFEEVSIEIPVRICGEIPTIEPAIIYFESGPNSYGILLDLSERDIIERSEERILFQKTMKKSYSPIGYIDRFYIEGTHIGRVESAGAAADEHGVIRLPEVELLPSFAGTLQFITSDGMLITNVIATGGTTRLNQLKENGPTYTMPSCSQTPVQISIIPPDGFINETRAITFEKAQVIEWVLQPGVPFSGTVLNQLGKPVEGAEIRLAGGPEKRGLWRVNDYPAIATTDASGRFSFTRMAAGEAYNLLIMADGYMGKSSGLITADESGRTFTLLPQKKVEVHIKNMQLLKRKDVELNTSLRLSPDGYFQTRLPEEWCRLVSSNSTTAIYELSNLWEGNSQYTCNSTLWIGLISHEFDPSKMGDTLTIDIAEKLPPEKRAVLHRFTIRLIPPNEDPLPQGSLEILHYQELAGYPVSFSIPSDGVIHADLMARPKSEVRLSSKAITGYKVDHAFTADSTNMVVDVPLIPTGCIMVTCVDLKGNPLKNYSVNIEAQGPDVQGASGWSNLDIRDPVYINDNIPLNQKCRVRVSKSTPDGKISTEYTSDWFTLTDAHPVKEISCELKDLANIQLIRSPGNNHRISTTEE
ncbi:MAG: M48 family metalloprotease [Pontiellaceae bacterium]|nr:M48 family metalloprotease [Pontiellaceae bacterium]